MIEGNQKLARIMAMDEKAGKMKLKAVVETRGEGGYVLVPGSPAECHYLNREYVHVAGPPILETPTITPEERQAIFEAARSFNEVYEDVSTAVPEPRKIVASPGGRPGDDFNTRATWREILEPHGWTVSKTDGHTTYWRRPSKEGPGWSGNTGHCTSEGGNDLLYIFSTNASPFESEASYSKFSAYAILNHNGDFVAAARQLAVKGYGNGKPTQLALSIGDPRKRFLPRRLDEVLDMPPTPWLIEQLIPANVLVVMYGPSESGKSFIGLDMAMSVAAGIPFFGREVKRGSIAYIAAERSQGIGKRAKAWLIGHQHSENPAGMYLIAEAPNLLAYTDSSQLLEALRELPERPVLIVIDTMARVMVGGDENSAKDLGLVVAAIDRIRQEFECAVLLIHHSGRQGEHERGSSALRGAADVMIKVKRTSRHLISVSADKSSEHEAFTSFSLRLHHVESVDSCYLEPAKHATLGETNLRVIETVKTLAGCGLKLRVDIIPWKTWRDAFIEQTGQSEDTFDRRVNEAVSASLVESREGGYCLTDAGEEIVTRNYPQLTRKSTTRTINPQNPHTPIRGADAGSTVDAGKKNSRRGKVNE